MGEREHLEQGASAPDDRPILVAFDRTPGADAAVDEAARIALAVGAPVELVFVWQAPLDLAVPMGTISEHTQPDEMERACGERTLHLTRLGVSRASHRIEPGDPAERLIALSTSGRYRLLALGTHGRTGLRRLALGSVAERVVRAARCPILTVRRSERPAVGEPRRPSGRILVASDFSASSEAALAQAIALSHAFGAQLTLVHCWEPPVVVDEVGAMASWMFDDSAARAMLHDKRTELERQGVARLIARLMHGPALDGILRAAEELDPDLLVMGTHGRRGIGRLVLGSVAERVVRHASCPVLTVHAAETHAAETRSTEGDAHPQH
jgi:nucleotide-binding universal stress UspA family protein